jgi:hypothetical protein
MGIFDSGPFSNGWRFKEKYTPNYQGKEIPLPTFEKSGKPKHESIRQLELDHKIQIVHDDLISRQIAQGCEFCANTMKPKRLNGAKIIVELVLVDKIHTTTVGTFAIPILNKSHLIQFESSTDPLISVDWNGVRYPVAFTTSSFIVELTGNNE